MRDIGYKIIAILIIVLLIALWLYVIIGGISVGDYEILTYTLVFGLGYFLYLIIDRKLLEPLWISSTRSKYYIKIILIVSTLMFLILFTCRVTIARNGIAVGILNGLSLLFIYPINKYRKLWKLMK